jgi:hypothetical protein
MLRTTKILYISLVALSAALAGCGQTPTQQATNVPAKDAMASSSSPTKTAGSAAHDHSEWWCNEHGVPEEECGLCNAKLAAQFQKKGDWCKEHDRPDSQCFLCHPEKEALYAAKYEAKYGEQPPKPERE